MLIRDEEGESVQTPSWDLFIGLFFVVVIGYGFVLQRDKVIVTLLSIYVGIVVANTFSPVVQKFFAGEQTIGDSVFIRSSASPFAIEAALFGLTLILVGAKSGLTSKTTKGILSPIELITYSALNAALVLSTIFGFMDEASRAHIIETSKIGRIVLQYTNLWLVAPLLFMFLTGGLGKSNSN